MLGSDWLKNLEKADQKRNYQVPKMCKSQNRREVNFIRPAPMLMLHELHNWLPFMPLTAAGPSSRNRPIGPCGKKFRNWYSITQGFPQVDPPFLARPQT